MLLARRSLLWAGALTVAGAGTLLWLTRDRREIAELLDRLVHAATKPNARSRQVLRAGLEPEVGISVFNSAQERHSQEELISAWQQASARVGPLFIELRELEVQVEGDAARAHGEALVSQSQHDDIHARVHRFVVHLTKAEDRWRLSALSVEDGAPVLPEARP